MTESDKRALVTKVRTWHLTCCSRFRLLSGPLCTIGGQVRCKLALRELEALVDRAPLVDDVAERRAV